MDHVQKFVSNTQEIAGMAKSKLQTDSGFGRESFSIAVDPSPSFSVYEEQLSQESRWAFGEGSRHYEEKSSVFEALYMITSKLGKLGIPYAVVGGMALFRHGVRRFTENVAILVSCENLTVIHEKLSGLGCLPPFRSSRNLRDTDPGVKIEFLKTGDFPGDGRPKPVSFQDPGCVSFLSDGIHDINLPVLVELKLASGMTGSVRLKDLADVLELIKALNLPQGFADQLNPIVRGKYQELWSQVRHRYITVWHVSGPLADLKTIRDLLRYLPSAAVLFDQMIQDGLQLEPADSLAGDRVVLVTTDPTIAEKYEMVEESEYWDREQEGLG